MAPRGLSVEEKRVKLLEIFHETKDFYQLKELEKLGPKMKGIVSQTVKEILQSLVDDGLVQSDKIGASNFFWSFPSQRGAMMTNKLANAKKNHESLQVQIKQAKESLATETALRVESDHRSAAIAKLDKAKATVSELEKELEQYGACDPAQVEEKKRALILAHEAVVRWTDNLSVALSYFASAFAVDTSAVRVHFNIKEDFEDIPELGKI
ncbi:meiotic nuclear division protein 1 [Sistotremastrum niveocremeum HHB9708]|uniref:Meiotic nuclear division protein 1 n=1 Tax=Sistotremastrum niveocremeum HHB9708 TaxID=1314777 RepID=A0A164ZXD5_9AGAM|nr:meiotic nuclear division protein 1 [Sistotremastrum niveocremeum HHB9708]